MQNKRKHNEFFICIAISWVPFFLSLSFGLWIRAYPQCIPALCRFRAQDNSFSYHGNHCEVYLLDRWTKENLRVPSHCLYDSSLCKFEQHDMTICFLRAKEYAEMEIKTCPSKEWCRDREYEISSVTCFALAFFPFLMLVKIVGEQKEQ